MFFRTQDAVYAARMLRRTEVVFVGQQVHVRVSVPHGAGEDATVEMVDVLGRVTQVDGDGQSMVAVPGSRFVLAVERLGSGGEALKLDNAPAPGRAQVHSMEQVGDPTEPSGVVGSIRDMSVAEVLQSLELGLKTARVEYRPKGRASGVVYMAAGRVVFAEWERWRGEVAVYALMRMSRGAFLIRFGMDAPAHNITDTTTALLLEGMRRMDERLADGIELEDSHSSLGG